MPAPEATLTLPGLPRDKMLAAGRAFLAGAGVEAAAEDARLLLMGACGIDRLALVTGAGEAVLDRAARQYRSYLDRRAAGEPVSRILGRRAFWTLDLEVRPGVLDPRADSEALVRLALRVGRVGGRAPGMILDLGCGSGALLCALLSEWEGAFGLGVDLSAQACAATRANIALCSLRGRAAVIQSSWCEALSPGFDLVVSNPPYIQASKIAELDREVRDHDPHLALNGGVDGLDAYRELFGAARRVLASGGALVVEFGLDQAKEVERLAANVGIRKIDSERDLAGRDRASAFVVA